MENYTKQTGKEKGVSALPQSSRAQKYAHNLLIQVTPSMPRLCLHNSKPFVVSKGKDRPNALEAV